MIEPYLKRKTPTAIGDKQLYQSVEDRKKLVSSIDETLFKWRENALFSGWNVRMYSMHLLFNSVSQLLVECW